MKRLEVVSLHSSPRAGDCNKLTPGVIPETGLPVRLLNSHPVEVDESPSSPEDGMTWTPSTPKAMEVFELEYEQEFR